MKPSKIQFVVFHNYQRLRMFTSINTKRHDVSGYNFAARIVIQKQLVGVVQDVGSFVVIQASHNVCVFWHTCLHTG